MTKVDLYDLLFDYGTPWIGIASLVLFGLSFILVSGDAKLVRGAAGFGVLMYIGCVLAKIEHNREKKEKRHGEA